MHGPGRGGYMSPHVRNFQTNTNADLIFNATGEAGRSHRLDGFNFSYSANPTGAYYLIEIAEPEDLTVFKVVDKMFITNGGPGPLDMVRGFETPSGYALRITLKAGGAGIGSTLTVFGEFPIGKN